MQWSVEQSRPRFCSLAQPTVPGLNLLLYARRSARKYARRAHLARLPPAKICERVRTSVSYRMPSLFAAYFVREDV